MDKVVSTVSIKFYVPSFSLRPGCFPKSLLPSSRYQSLRAESLQSQMSVWTAVWLFLNHNIFVALQRWRTQERGALFVYVYMYAPWSAIHVHTRVCVDRGQRRVRQRLKLPSSVPFCSFSETIGLQCCCCWLGLIFSSTTLKREWLEQF